jgi:hypothetical protein
MALCGRAGKGDNPLALSIFGLSQGKGIPRYSRAARDLPVFSIRVDRMRLSPNGEALLYRSVARGQRSNLLRVLLHLVLGESFPAQTELGEPRRALALVQASD